MDCYRIKLEQGRRFEMKTPTVITRKELDRIQRWIALQLIIVDWLDLIEANYYAPPMMLPPL